MACGCHGNLTDDENVNAVIQSEEYPFIIEQLKNISDYINKKAQSQGKMDPSIYTGVWEKAFDHLLHGCPEAHDHTAEHTA